MKSLVWMLLICCSFGVYGQQPVSQLSFEDQSGKGIVGKALNLGPDVASRRPLELQNPLYQHHGAFTVMLWVKADASQYATAEIITAPGNAGWRIGVQESGAWYWQSSRNNTKYEYAPTVARQTLRDGRWHLLAFVYDPVKKESQLYYDGLNTAIYYTPGLDSLHFAPKIYVGGKVSGDIGEWDTFNGMIDEVAFYQSALSAEKISGLYRQFYPARTVGPPSPPATIRVMNYNIWHGGNETGKDVGPQRIVDVIRSSGADIVSMQETYGSGPRIADALGYYFYLRSSNLSIMSRYPIAETLEGEAPFYNGGAYISISNSRKIAFFTNWLSYPFDYWDMMEKNQPIQLDTLLAGMEKANTARLRSILQVIQPHTDKAEEIPVIFCGDFNSGSHLDWIPAARQFNNGYVVPFPASLAMYGAGYKDAFRQLHPDPVKERGITWSPQFPNAFKDRIDHIYYKGGKLRPLKFWTITTHPVRYPSDHAAVVAEFKLSE